MFQRKNMLISKLLPQPVSQPSNQSVVSSPMGTRPRKKSLELIFNNQRDKYINNFNWRAPMSERLPPIQKTTQICLNMYFSQTISVEEQQTFPMDAHLYLVCFVEEKTEVCEHDPQFLPSISSLEFPQQFSTHLILK